MRGAFCLSIDVELGWGFWDIPSARYFRECAEKERHIVDRMLEILGRYGASATWAIVGRLVERAPRPPVETPHGDLIWYAPDIVDRIRSASPCQDVGSHGFAHIYFGKSSRAQAEEDLAAARSAGARRGLDLASFVFPRNQVAHLDLLAAAGVKVFRSVDVGWHTVVGQRGGALPGRAANLADKILPLPPATVRPRRHANGLVELPSSMLLLGRDGLRRLAPPRTAVLKAELGLARARRRGEVFHLWCHPSNFYFDTKRQLGVLERIVMAACRERDRGLLEVRTMRSFASA